MTGRDATSTYLYDHDGPAALLDARERGYYYSGEPAKRSECASLDVLLSGEDGEAGAFGGLVPDLNEHDVRDDAGAAILVGRRAGPLPLTVDQLLGRWRDQVWRTYERGFQTGRCTPDQRAAYLARRHLAGVLSREGEAAGLLPRMRSAPCQGEPQPAGAFVALTTGEMSPGMSRSPSRSPRAGFTSKETRMPNTVSPSLTSESGPASGHRVGPGSLTETDLRDLLDAVETAYEAAVDAADENLVDFGAFQPLRRVIARLGVALEPAA
ncbi:MAG: hypothetical protein M0Z49_16185 [Chloroflexi bacterium]|nr:hypothetical protein [Chloroflexota bacterium]